MTICWMHRPEGCHTGTDLTDARSDEARNQQKAEGADGNANLFDAVLVIELSSRCQHSH